MKKIPTNEIYFTRIYSVKGKKIRLVDNQYKAFQRKEKNNGFND